MTFILRFKDIVPMQAADFDKDNGNLVCLNCMAEVPKTQNYPLIALWFPTNEV